ncbi:hypothetical protein [Clostridium phage Saumur]|nr:hypothetical protein [Clostridium phage Saumur]
MVTNASHAVFFANFKFFHVVFPLLSFDDSIIYLRKYKGNRQNKQNYGSIIVNFVYFRNLHGYGIIQNKKKTEVRKNGRAAGRKEKVERSQRGGGE